jgi:beta-galactosidase
MSFRLVRPLAILLWLVLVAAGHAGELYVGADYHPHDSNPETWTRENRLMREGGFRVVRMGQPPVK